jgi:nicotinamidase-related amidase
MPRRKKRSSRALLLVDFINLMNFSGADKLGPRAIRAARAAAKLKAHLASQGVPCIYANDNFGDWRSEFSALVRSCMDTRGPARILAETLRPAPQDLSVLKPRHSAFYGTPLDFLLEELGVTRLVIAGIAIDMCVVATAQDAYVRKFTLAIPSNCSAGFSPAQEKEALSLMSRTMRADTSAPRGRPPGR